MFDYDNMFKVQSGSALCKARRLGAKWHSVLLARGELARGEMGKGEMGKGESGRHPEAMCYEIVVYCATSAVAQSCAKTKPGVPKPVLLL